MKKKKKNSPRLKNKKSIKKKTKTRIKRSKKKFKSKLIKKKIKNIKKNSKNLLRKKIIKKTKNKTHKEKKGIISKSVRLEEKLKNKFSFKFSFNLLAIDNFIQRFFQGIELKIIRLKEIRQEEKDYINQLIINLRVPSSIVKAKFGDWDSLKEEEIPSVVMS